MQQNDTDINVLLLYQYDHKNHPNGHPFIEECRKSLSDFELADGRQVYVRTLPEACGKTHTEWTKDVFERFVGIADGWSYQLAFAIVVEDQRHASEAGNLFFEVGYWLARRGASAIRIVTNGDVSVPSDFRGPVIEAVTTGDSVYRALHSLISTWANEQRERQSSIDHKKVQKVKRVIIGTENWANRDFSYCRNGQQHVACDLRLSGLTAFVELKRNADHFARKGTLLLRVRALATRVKALEPHHTRVTFALYLDETKEAATTLKRFIHDAFGPLDWPEGVSEYLEGGPWENDPDRNVSIFQWCDSLMSMEADDCIKGEEAKRLVFTDSFVKCHQKLTSGCSTFLRVVAGEAREDWSKFDIALGINTTPLQADDGLIHVLEQSYSRLCDSYETGRLKNVWRDVQANEQ